MTDLLSPGDFVSHPKVDGVRGQVLWVDRGTIYVCWETGYEPFEPHHISELKKLNVLDLLIDDRELKFEHTNIRARCRCGVTLQGARRKALMVCPSCRRYYALDGTLVGPHPPATKRPKPPPASEDDDVLNNVRRVRRRWLR